MSVTKTKAIYICAPKRSAIGALGGSLASLRAPEICVPVVQDVLKSASVASSDVQSVILGCVLTAGIGQAPARQVAIKAGLPESTQALTVNKVCSSGLKAVMLAANDIALGHAECVVAGGMESMSQAPYLLPALRQGARLGHTAAEDSIIRDGLWDVYNNFHMGNAAELCAREFSISRAQQDAFATESYRRANEAAVKGLFKNEITPVTVRVGKSTQEVIQDEEPLKFQPDKIAQLKPVFDKDGTVTAANASSINDGAAAMVVCSEDFAKKHSLRPQARIVEQGWAAQKPEWFTTAPIGAVEHLLGRAKIKIGTIDLFEINEAFSAVALACGQKLAISSDKLNICGGAVALGHPIGASGARILTTLIYSLHREQRSLGVAAICNGGGEATALLVERV